MDEPNTTFLLDNGDVVQIANEEEEHVADAMVVTADEPDDIGYQEHLTVQILNSSSDKLPVGFMTQIAMEVGPDGQDSIETCDQNIMWGWVDPPEMEEK